MKVVLLLMVCFVGVSTQKTLFDVVKLSGNHSILMDLGVYAGVADLMKEPGPWTLFAPNDAAFGRLPHGYLENLKKNLTLLNAFLEYHVVRGLLMEKDLSSKDMEVWTTSGQEVRINVYPSTKVVTVEGSTVVNFNDMASNGVMHSLDRVLIAPKNNLFEAIKSRPLFSIFADLLTRAGLEEELKNGPYTVFAPLDEGFLDMGNETLKRLKNNPVLLKKILKYHIVHGEIWQAGLHATQLDSLAGKVSVTDYYFGMMLVENALVLGEDIPAINGVVQEINKPMDIPDLKSNIIG